TMVIFGAYTLPYFLAALFLVALAPFVWRRRATTGATAYTALLLACAFWCLCSAAEVAATTLEGKQLADRVKYLGILVIPPAWLVFSLQYTGRLRRLAPRLLAAFMVVPLVTMALLWTNGHTLMIYNYRLDPDSPGLIVSYGLAFRVMGTYQYGLLLVGSAYLIASLAHTHRLFRAQGLLLLLACALPFATNTIHALKAGPVPFLDLTPPTFAVSAAITALGVMRFRMFELVPAARRAVIETMPDAILVFDVGGRIVDANPAAIALFHDTSLRLVGRQVQSLLPAADRHLLLQPDPDRPRTIIELTEAHRLMELRLCPIGESARHSGWLALFQDVTEREALIAQLQEAVASVRTLSGLIPICAACKRVRDDGGYWRQVESYLSDRSQAEFTHSICPECAAKLYPEYPQPGRA
ncbi:MAG: histidine kinase N-terminal 7TM domain-containing protein, partial [Anaerolineae bacterium]